MATRVSVGTGAIKQCGHKGLNSRTEQGIVWELKGITVSCRGKHYGLIRRLRASQFTGVSRKGNEVCMESLWVTVRVSF